MKCPFDKKRICPHYNSEGELYDFECIETCAHYPQSKTKDFILWKWILKWIDSRAK